MSVRAISINNLKKRHFALSFEKKKKVFKAFLSDCTLPRHIRFNINNHYLSQFPNNSNLNKSSNKCVFTGRTRVI